MDGIKCFCGKLEILVHSMPRREELILDSVSTTIKYSFKHKIKIEKVHNPNRKGAYPFLMLNHTVETSSGRRILIESYTYTKVLMLNTVYYYGFDGDGSCGMDVSNIELLEKTRLCSEDSIVNFDSLFEQMDLAMVKYI